MLMDPILTKDTPFPTSNTKTYYTRPFQTEATIPVMQGEATLAKDCHLISEATLRVPRVSKASAFTVTYKIDENGILQCSAAVTTDPDNPIVITIDEEGYNLPEEELERLRQLAEAER